VMCGNGAARMGPRVCRGSENGSKKEKERKSALLRGCALWRLEGVRSTWVVMGHDAMTGLWGSVAAQVAL
jgi:hypothetical protein